MPNHTQTISEALVDFLRANDLEKPLLERKVVELWPEIMGPTIASMTRSVEMTNGMLRIKLNNAALKAQLFECRFELVKKLNQAVGCEIIHDVRLY